MNLLSSKCKHVHANFLIHSFMYAYKVMYKCGRVPIYRYIYMYIYIDS